MKKRLLTLLASCMLACAIDAAAALAEIPAYTYDIDGGIHGMAVSEDGLVVFTGMAYRDYGEAENAKQDGYAICIDAQGNERWRVTQNLHEDGVSLNVMRAPAFREDGSVTMVLETSFHLDAGGNWDQAELLRVGASGQIVSRSLMMGEQVDGLHYINGFGAPAALGKNILLSRSERESDDPTNMQTWMHPTNTYYLYGESGNRLRTLDALCALEIDRVSDAHALVIEQDKNTALYAIDGKGNVTRLATAYTPQGNVYVEDLLSLPDGGAAMTGFYWRDEGNESFIRRYDAQGNVVFETKTGAWRQSGLAKTPNGFAAIGIFGEPLSSGELSRELMFFDGDGKLVLSRSLDELNIAGGGYNIAALPDGSLMVASSVNAADEHSFSQLRVAVIPKEDIP